MVEFTVTTAKGDEKELKLFDYVPTKTGMDARAKLNVNVDAKGQSANVEMENALKKADNAKRFLVEEMLEKSGCEIDIDELSFESFEEIARYYWSQIQGDEAKN